MDETKSDTTDEHNWSTDLETQLENIEKNSVVRCEIARKEYLQLIQIQKYFQIPVIIISGINSIFAVGLTSYMNQSLVSVLNCLLSFFVSIIQSIALYLNITKRIEISLSSYRDFYLLSIKINNCLRLNREHRSELDGRTFLRECLSEYETLFSNSNVNILYIEDKLIENNVL